MCPKAPNALCSVICRPQMPPSTTLEVRPRCWGAKSTFFCLESRTRREKQDKKESCHITLLLKASAIPDPHSPWQLTASKQEVWVSDSLGSKMRNREIEVIIPH